MNSKLKKDIKSAFDPPKARRKERFLNDFDYPKATQYDFISSQIGYIRKRVWIVSGILVLSVLYYTFFVFNCRELNILWTVSSLLPFVALVSITEIARSTSYRMQELEMSCKHRFSEVVLARLGILGSFNIIVFAIIILALVGKTDYSLIQFSLYILTPYLFTCILSLFTLQHFSIRETNYVCGGISCFVSILNNILIYSYHIVYTDAYLHFWIILFSILLITVIIQVNEFVKKTEELSWSLQ
ncbi:hypothetical protein SH1V18_12070 [Vallitalea longa]|uniref:Uncharacterized protein n=1 Tax=Vallitalea longa TaxID=2936439 RepID=A0A9W6DER4_9FIRM|nr:hypothetical protein [Vallitalea longa]GKX28727.1 hypothetical protein SH1V18_12070 [Vallitalea longa]